MTIKWPAGYAMREFALTDIQAFPAVAATLSLLHDDPVAWLSRIKTPAFTVTKEDVPVLCAGVMLLHRGSGYAWQFSNGDLDRRPKFYLAGVRQALRAIEAEYGLWRIEATCDAESAPAIRWLKHLGFAVIGLKHSYVTRGKDHLEFERVKED